ADRRACAPSRPTPGGRSRGRDPPPSAPRRRAGRTRPAGRPGPAGRRARPRSSWVPPCPSAGRQSIVRHAEMPHRLDLDAYLARIAYPGPREPTGAVLDALHEAHVTAIPFENLDVRLHRPISLTLPDLEAKLVAGGRGGYCFEQNTLFAAVLRELGFVVRTLEARVRG